MLLRTATKNPDFAAKRRLPGKIVDLDQERGHNTPPMATSSCQRRGAEIAPEE
jgi:hypothetical protein